MFKEKFNTCFCLYGVALCYSPLFLTVNDPRKLLKVDKKHIGDMLKGECGIV